MEKKAEEADDDDEDDLKANKEPEKPNPLDALPKSTFILDAWKRFYSNNETRPDAINWFWDNYDPAGYSIWKLSYKYNSELTKIFMSSNLVGGFFQRLEKVRKYAFGSMCVFGEDGNNEIGGIFVFRGSEVPEDVKDVADYESYTFSKVENLEDPSFRELFGDYLAWDGKFGGKKFADGKIYK